MDKEKLKAATALICDDNELRPWMRATRLIEGCFVATDGIIGIWGPKTGLEEPYNGTPPAPKAVTLFEQYKHTPINQRVKLNHLKDQLKKAPLVDEWDYSQITECPTCNGEGEVEWKFEDWTREDYCPKCGGEGEIGDPVETGKRIIDSDAEGEIFGAWMKLRQLQRVIDFCEIIDLKEVDCTHTDSKNNVLVFDLGNSYQLLIMGCSRDSKKTPMRLLPILKEAQNV